MTAIDVVIVGGGPAALSTAKSYRDSGGEGRVTIVARESDAPYRRPPLTKEFLRGEIPSGELPMEDQDWYRENGVELRLSTEVTSLDALAQTLSLSDGSTVSYGECVLATGSEPAIPSVPGADDPAVHVVRTLSDSEKLVSTAKNIRESGGDFVVLGSGFIGCEAAASLAMLGVSVRVVTLEDAPQKERLGPDAAREIRRWLMRLGVEIIPGAKVEKIERDKTFRLTFDNGESISGDGLVVGAGVTQNTALAENAGLEVDGGVVCDASMRTSSPHVFAAGDAAFAHNVSAGRRLKVEHWGDALGQGKVCGATLAGRDSMWGDVPGFWSSVGNHTIKYAAWGDGWDEAYYLAGERESFTVWYGLDGVCVGVLTHENDGDYEAGISLIESGGRIPV